MVQLKTKDLQVLSEIEQVRAIAREDRLRMLSLLAEETLTVSGVARKLGMAPNRAHYHIRQLCENGLVCEVGTGKMRYREERYYQAAARNFLMDPRLACGDRETSAAVLQSAENAFLDWRRKEILDIDLAEVAALVVNDCLRVSPGKTVLVMFGPQGLELAEAILVELRAVGSSPRPALWSRNFLLRTLDRNSSETLAGLPFLEPDLDAELDAVVFVSSSMPQGGAPNATQQAKPPLILEAVSRWQQQLRARRIPYLELDLPHRGGFEGGRVGPEQAIDVYWRCIRTDYRALGDRARCLLERIGETPQLVLRCPRGTRLQVALDPNRIHLNDGVISEEDIENGHCWEVLPAGSLSVLPVPGSATGTFVGDYVFVGGRHIWDVTVEIDCGRIVKVDAPEGADWIRDAVAQAAGDADCLSSVGFGLNPAGKGPTGFPVLDGCLEGAVVLSFGNNEQMGGDVRSTLDLSFPSLSLTVRAGGATLVERGALIERRR
jgi:leucyl aminopeptidase (aminopeptidase T)